MLTEVKVIKVQIEWLPETNRCQYIKTFEMIVDQNKLSLNEIEKRKYSELKKKECGESL